MPITRETKEMLKKIKWHDLFNIILSSIEHQLTIEEEPSLELVISSEEDRDTIERNLESLQPEEFFKLFDFLDLSNEQKIKHEVNKLLASEDYLPLPVPQVTQMHNGVEVRYSLAHLGVYIAQLLAVLNFSDKSLLPPHYELLFDHHEGLAQSPRLKEDIVRFFNEVWRKNQHTKVNLTLYRCAPGMSYDGKDDYGPFNFESAIQKAFIRKESDWFLMLEDRLKSVQSKLYKSHHTKTISRPTIILCAGGADSWVTDSNYIVRKIENLLKDFGLFCPRIFIIGPKETVPGNVACLKSLAQKTGGAYISLQQATDHFAVIAKLGLVQHQKMLTFAFDFQKIIKPSVELLVENLRSVEQLPNSNVQPQIRLVEELDSLEGESDSEIEIQKDVSLDVSQGEKNSANTNALQAVNEQLLQSNTQLEISSVEEEESSLSKRKFGWKRERKKDVQGEKNLANTNALQAVNEQLPSNMQSVYSVEEKFDLLESGFVQEKVAEVAISSEKAQEEKKLENISFTPLEDEQDSREVGVGIGSLEKEKSLVNTGFISSVHERSSKEVGVGFVQVADVNFFEENKLESTSFVSSMDKKILQEMRANTNAVQQAESLLSKNNTQVEIHSEEEESDLESSSDSETGVEVTTDLEIDQEEKKEEEYFNFKDAQNAQKEKTEHKEKPSNAAVLAKQYLFEATLKFYKSSVGDSVAIAAWATAFSIFKSPQPVSSAANTNSNKVDDAQNSPAQYLGHS